MAVTDLQLQLPMDRIKEYCHKWKVREMWVFGSAAGGNFRPDSDLDVLVRFSPEARWSLLEMVGAEQELSLIVGRPVDLVERESVEESSNWLRRRHILENAKRIYVA